MKIVSCLIFVALLTGCSEEQLLPLNFNCAAESTVLPVARYDMVESPLKPFGLETTEINGEKYELNWQQFKSDANEMHFSILSDWRLVENQEAYFLFGPDGEVTKDYFALVNIPKDAALSNLDDYISLLQSEVMSDSTMAILELVNYSSEARGAYFIEMSSTDSNAAIFSFITESPTCVLDFTMKSSNNYVYDKAHFLSIMSSLTIGEQYLISADASFETVSIGIN